MGHTARNTRAAQRAHVTATAGLQVTSRRLVMDQLQFAAAEAYTLPTHSLMMLHKLTLFSACAGLGRPCLRSGAGSSACSQSGGSCHLRTGHVCAGLSPPSRAEVVQPQG